VHGVGKETFEFEPRKFFGDQPDVLVAYADRTPLRGLSLSLPER